jgi:DnaK suppressor protein
LTADFNLLRRRLETERKSLLERLKTNFRPTERPESPRGEEGEAASEALELEKRLAMEGRKRDLLAEVEHALHKFELGTYGLCDVCGQPIERERLEALPQANLCLRCKARI